MSKSSTTKIPHGMQSAALQALPQPVLICNVDNKIISANYAAETFFGISQQVLYRHKIDDLFAFGSPVLQMVDDVRQQQSPRTEFRVNASPMRSTLERQTDIYCSPIPEFLGAVSLLFQERTMADKIDRQLVSQGAVRSATGLAAMLAHEIKNPLSGIRGAAQLLEQTIPVEEQQFARLIRDETDRIVKLIDRVEVFGDQRPVERSAVNIHQVLDRVRLLALSGVAEGVQIIQNYDPSLPFVFGNQDQLIQVFLNVIKNSAEAFDNKANSMITISTGFKPGIKISTAGQSDRISLPLEILIKDNGPGVPEHILPFMFDPFVTAKSGGSGLGLALVAKIISDHGGVVECDSKPGRTQFRILLPMAPSDRGATSL